MTGNTRLAARILLAHRELPLLGCQLHYCTSDDDSDSFDAVFRDILAVSCRGSDHVLCRNDDSRLEAFLCDPAVGLASDAGAGGGDVSGQPDAVVV